MTMSTGDLPEYPTRGNRRRLDEAWLELLHRDGAARFLKQVPNGPAGLIDAVEEFNQGMYWQCHETLEGLWIPEGYPLRLFYHGLIKAAVGLLHLERRNHPGALAKLRDAQYTLYPFSPGFMGLDIARLRVDLAERLARVEGDGLVDWEAVAGLPAVRLHPEPGLPAH
jgi:uncharacterized protein